MTPDLKADLLRLVDGVSAIGDASSLRARVKAATITEPGESPALNFVVPAGRPLHLPPGTYRVIDGELVRIVDAPPAVRLARVAFPDQEWELGGTHTALRVDTVQPRGNTPMAFRIRSLDDLALAERRVCEAGFQDELEESIARVASGDCGVLDMSLTTFADAPTRAAAPALLEECRRQREEIARLRLIAKAAARVAFQIAADSKAEADLRRAFRAAGFAGEYRETYAALAGSDPRDAEIARLRAALEGTAAGLEIVSGSGALSPKVRAAFVGTVEAIRAALAGGGQ